MMQATSIKQPMFQSSPSEQGNYWQARVQRAIPRQGFELDEGGLAQAAYSCVIEPSQDDLVLCFRDSALMDSPVFILAVLQRDNPGTANISVPGCDQLRIVQPRIKCLAKEKLELGCLKDIELTAARGSIRIQAINLVQSLTGSIVETCRERIANADFVQFCASFLTRIHSKQTVFTAEGDIKIDAERVNLG